ncbi:MAG: hypothetical protein A2086_00645 [Spirochaetes bacterium GWD1_27_9]|nr:MAG: hypothetical protein A2Z98_05155 [Spirochaetes bacterium GWB1_27_13]OHD21718.1 MAG: hypothetical protein A2Y34_08445 [Spirochaetes bacterium GWC1_27_15]OHD32518.1 MAG: hypothetical protein A2086_00645 [Spirochaetes bacterium GWD1_27_9]
MGPIGHLSIGFATKRFAPKIPLWILLVSSWFIDIIFMIFAFLGIEGMENLKKAGSVPSPLSHGLFMALVWSILAVIVSFLISKNKKYSLIIGLVVFSHWILDFIVWSNQFLFFVGSPQVGFGLYDKFLFNIPNGMIIASLVEFALFIPCLILYLTYVISKRKKEGQI